MMSLLIINQPTFRVDFRPEFFAVLWKASALWWSLVVKRALVVLAEPFAAGVHHNILLLADVDSIHIVFAHPQE